ncbi:Dol-P-Glc:Glc(2)Man(9)GlcNAc(2)-PP-Dol alpha-1,2-glucosyltransferase, partial [Cucurbita argyrosperma subsp. sororia]
MDEIFHVPQAQKCCSGNFRSWDPKISNPPGLFHLPTLLLCFLPLSLLKPYHHFLKLVPFIFSVQLICIIF